VKIFLSGPQIGSLELTGWEDRGGGFHPGIDAIDSIPTADIEFVDVPAGTIPVLSDFLLAQNLTVKVYDDDGVTLIFRGRISEPVLRSSTAMNRWHLKAQGEGARSLEASTTSAMDKTGVTDIDRNFVIAMFRDALRATPFGGAGMTIDDPIIAANEPDWSGVKGTAAVAGRNWANMKLEDALRSLEKIVPGVFHRIGPDQLVQYGQVGQDDAPFGIADETVRPLPADYAAIDAGSYIEQLVTAGAANRLKRGGASASVQTAYDEQLLARVGRVLEPSPYKVDTSIPSADLQRSTYAELATLGPKRQVKATIRRSGIKAGQSVPVINRNVLDGDDDARWAEAYFYIWARTDAGIDVDGIRGWLIAQCVERIRDAVGAESDKWELTLGDYMQDFTSQLADAIGG